MFHVGPILHRISLPPKGGQEGVKGKALLDSGVYVLADQAGDSGPAPALRVPLGVVFPLALGLDDGQAIVPAHGVGGAPHLAEVALKVAPVLLSVHKGDGVENDVTVIVLPVQVGGHHGLIAVPQQAAGKLHPGGVGLLRRHLAGGVGVDDVVAQDAALFVPATLGGLHFLKRGAGLTVDAGDELVGFLWIFRIGKGVRQTVLCLIEYIVQTVIQAGAQGDDFVVGHLELLLDQTGRLIDQGRRPP